MSAAKRHGEYWEYAEYAELVARVLGGESDHEIARALSRRPSAIRARARWLVGLDGRTVPESRALDRLAERLDNPNYDWEALLAEHARGQGGHLWMPEDDALLRRGWRDRDPLGVTAELLDVGELAVVHRLIRLGIAGSLVEVVDRLGCSKDGPVALRYRLAKHHADVTVNVLHVEGLPDGVSPHIEVTFTEEEVHKRLAELTGSPE